MCNMEPDQLLSGSGCSDRNRIRSSKIMPGPNPIIKIWSDSDPVFEIMFDTVYEIWSDPDPTFKLRRKNQILDYSRFNQMP